MMMMTSGSKGRGLAQCFDDDNDIYDHHPQGRDDDDDDDDNDRNRRSGT